jgi:hypothetical protein
MSRLRNSLTDTNSSGGGVSDHGALTGLADDDHTQYLNTTRHTAITGNPHGTVAGDISDFNETVRDVIGTALVAGSNVTITVNDPSDTITVAASSQSKTDVFTSNGTWTKESWCKSVFVQMIGGGAGGNAGGRQGTGVAAQGAGGGGGGCTVIGWFDPALFSSTETITVGTGGTGAAARTTDGNAVNGTSGTASTIGTKLRAAGGAAGSTVSGGIAITGGNFLYGSQQASVAGGNQNGTPTNAVAYLQATGGGGGGSISSSNATSAAGQGGICSNIGSVLNNGGGGSGAAGGGNGTGSPGTNGSSYASLYGWGGGGGAAHLTANAGAGGNGALYGGGGGGGGASRTGFNSGAGGNGANGIVIITQLG